MGHRQALRRPRREAAVAAMIACDTCGSTEQGARVVFERENGTNTKHCPGCAGLMMDVDQAIRDARFHRAALAAGVRRARL